jgi:hypothetical protein
LLRITGGISRTYAGSIGGPLLAEQARPLGALTAKGGAESLTRQDRLLCVLVEKFQPVWREIEEADLFRRRGLASREGLLVPQHVMIGLTMLRGLLAETGLAETGLAETGLAETGHGVLSWAELVARRETDPDVARQFKRWMNALTDYFNGTRALSSVDVANLARGLTISHPRPDLTADTLAGELLAYARPESCWMTSMIRPTWGVCGRVALAAARSG